MASVVRVAVDASADILSVVGIVVFESVAMPPVEKGMQM